MNAHVSEMKPSSHAQWRCTTNRVSRNTLGDHSVQQKGMMEMEMESAEGMFVWLWYCGGVERSLRLLPDLSYSYSPWRRRDLHFLFVAL